jgi:transposase
MISVDMTNLSKMTRSERESMQKRIVNFYLNIANKKKNVTVDHFLKEKIPRQTIYSIIKKYEKCGYVGDKPRSGGPKKLCRRQMTRLNDLVNHKTRVSLRQLASKFQVSYETIRTNLEEMNIKYYKKQRSPKYTDKQLQEVPIRARRLYQFLSKNDFQLIMNDEKFFLFLIN